jgi:hypothetical protein
MSTATASRSWILPLVFGLTLLNSWALFEELVVDRQGLWRYLPFYRVGAFCVWDLAALSAVGLLITSLRRSGRI